MSSRRIIAAAVCFGCLFLYATIFAADDSTSAATQDKVLVTDGHVVHDIGDLQNHVTNFGLIGSRPTITSTFGHAPSARWGGVDYLWAASVWVGGVVLGETLVSTGQYETEIRATTAQVVVSSPSGCAAASTFVYQ